MLPHRQLLSLSVVSLLVDYVGEREGGRAERQREVGERQKKELRLEGGPEVGSHPPSMHAYLDLGCHLGS